MQHKYTTYSGGYSTRKGSVILHRLGVTVRFESSIEEAALRVLGASPHVKSLERAEAVEVFLPTGEARTYTPDVTVHLTDGRVITVEVKPRALLAGILHNDPDLWQARSAYLTAHQRPLYFITEDDTPRIAVEQATLFNAYHAAPAHSTLRQSITHLLSERGPVPLRDVRSHLYSLHPELRDHLDGTLYSLIAQQVLHTDPLVAVPDCRVGLPNMGLALAPPIGRPLSDVMQEHPETPITLTSDHISPHEAAFLASPRGQRYLRLYSLYNDPAVTLTADLIRRLEEESGISKRSIFRFRNELRIAGPGCTFGEIVPALTRAQGRPRRQVLLTVREIIERIVHEHYLRPLGYPGRARTVADLHLLVRHACIAEELSPPAYNTVKAHLERCMSRDPVGATRLRDGVEAAQKIEGRQGHLPVTMYGELIGVDCTPCDVFTRENGVTMQLQRSGRGKGQRSADARRGNLITVQDIATGQILRSVVVLGPVSAQRILSVLRELFLGNVHSLTAAGVTHPPQARGLPRAVRVDGGTEFVNRAVKGALAYLGIETIARNKFSRHHGGREERVIQTLSWAHHLLPGTTANSIANRGEYDAQRGAVLSIDALNRYHQGVVERHNALCAEYQTLTRQEHAQRLLNEGLSMWRPLSEAQRRYVQERMHPAEPRRCARDGVHLHDLRYTSSALEPLIVRGATVLVHYDPDDISVAHAAHPDTGELIRLTARLPHGLEAPLSLSAWKELKERMQTARAAALDRQKTPHQIAAAVMAEHDARRHASKTQRMGASGDARACAPPVASAVGDDISVSRIRAAPIQFVPFTPTENS